MSNQAELGHIRPSCRRGGSESFTEMRARLEEVHGWNTQVAGMAARFYGGVDNYAELAEVVGDTTATEIRLCR